VPARAVGVVSLQLVLSLAMGRAEAKVKPPAAAVPQIAGAGTQSELSVALRAFLHVSTLPGIVTRGRHAAPTAPWSRAETQRVQADGGNMISSPAKMVSIVFRGTNGRVERRRTCAARIGQADSAATGRRPRSRESSIGRQPTRLRASRTQRLRSCGRTSSEQRDASGKSTRAGIPSRARTHQRLATGLALSCRTVTRPRGLNRPIIAVLPPCCCQTVMASSGVSRSSETNRLPL
jgi:hypothetical protein